MTEENVKFASRLKHHGVRPIVCCGESLTEQHHKDKCDINNIIAKYQSTGVIPYVNTGQPTYADFSEVGSYQEALDRVIAAENSFMSLPAKLRAKFSNDPGEMLEFVDNPANLERCYELGLIARPVQAASIDPQGDSGGQRPGEQSEPKEVA